jgi:non-specific serine/threonine protein kinase
VPRPLTALLGRDQELHTLIARIPTTRLITLTGPGGVGKTRLATEAAIEVGAVLAHGSHLVTIEALLDSGLIPQHIAKVLGIDLQTGLDWTETLVNHLCERQLLLVIDNCEHLLAACADLARKLLSCCPGLHLLATSRERLGLTGEVVRQIPPLAIPTHAALTDPEQCIEYSAIRLFCERAAAVRQDFQLSASNISEVVSICCHLDGLPLAIELAAALADTLSLHEIEANLEHRFQLLKGGDRTGQPRHQALKTALEWSYSRLTASEQALLCHLAVFSAGWTVAAAEAVFPEPPDKKREVRTLLSRLVSKSLVLASTGVAETRFNMLETIRIYGRDLLSQQPEWRSARQAHAEYYTVLAEQAAAELLGPAQVNWLERLEQEHANLRTALLWTTQETIDPQLAFRLGSALWRFWYIRGYNDEGQSWLKKVLQLPGEHPKPLRLVVLRGLGNLYYAREDTREARPCFEECLVLARLLGDERAQASALASLGNLATTGEQNYREARRLFLEAMSLFAALEDRRGLALTYSNLARLCCLSENDYEGARELHLKGLALFRQLGSLLEIAHECNNLAHTLLQLGESESARDFLHESLTLTLKLESGPMLAHCLTNCRSLAMLEGRMERAAVLIGVEMALRNRIGFPLPASALTDHRIAERTVRLSLGDSLFALRQSQGSVMSESELCAFILGTGVEPLSIA